MDTKSGNICISVSNHRNCAGKDVEAFEPLKRKLLLFPNAVSENGGGIESL
jgi:hypothetical protein